MKKLFLTLIFVSLLFSCSEKNDDNSKSKAVEKKELTKKEKSEDRVNIEGLYDIASDCGVYQSIKIRKVGKSENSYIVEFGHRESKYFQTIEGRYAYFTVYDYPNIEFSCPSGRTQKTYIGSNILEVYKLKVVKDSTKIYLNGFVYKAELGNEVPGLDAYRDKNQNIFKKVWTPNNGLGLNFYQPLPVRIKTLSFNRDRIILNGVDLEYNKKYIKEEVAKVIGDYKDYIEAPDTCIIEYPDIELQFNYDMEFERIAKNLDGEKTLKAFGFEFSTKTSREDLNAFIAKKNYQKEEGSTSFDIIIDENIRIYCCFDDSNTHLERVLVGKEIEEFYMPEQ